MNVVWFTWKDRENNEHLRVFVEPVDRAKEKLLEEGIFELTAEGQVLSADGPVAMAVYNLETTC